MAEKKADKKAETKKVEKKTTEKKAAAKKAETKKKPEVKVELTAEVEPKKEKKEKKEVAEAEPKAEKKGKSCCGKVWLAIILTFLITSILFGVAFFVFMNLEVVDRNGTVRIDHGKIYVDNRWQCESDVMPVEEGGKDETGKDETGRTSTGSGELITNPNGRVAVNNATLIEVGDFEVYLPKNFTAARGNGNGKYTYNLTDDDGWADVKIYAEKTNADLLTYMSKKDSLLKLTNSTYYMNGTSWAEMESGSSLAYGTRLGDMIYVVILNVKLESDATSEAEQMIPKTLRLKRIYK